jgi:hypothetical protein
MNTVFKFREGSRLSGNAQQVGEALMEIHERKGQLVAPDVVQEASDHKHPLHPRFEWNDETAGHQWRLEQARHLIRSVVLIETESHGEMAPVRAFAKITTENRSSYEPIMKVMSDSQLRAKVLTEVKEEIRGLRDKLESLNGVAKVLGALQRVEKVVDRSIKEVSLG